MTGDKRNVHSRLTMSIWVRIKKIVPSFLLLKPYMTPRKYVVPIYKDGLSELNTTKVTHNTATVL